MRPFARLALLLALPTAAACGANAASPSAAPTAASAPSSSVLAQLPQPAAAPADSAAAPRADEHSHALMASSTRQNPVVLEVVLPEGKGRSDFPKQLEADATCWKTVELRGDHDKDYEALMSRCGEPTGMLPYTRPVESRLHDVRGGDKKDPRDFLSVRVREGMCYRFYAVADEAMVDLDMHIYKGGGALVAVVETRSPALIVQSRAPLCPDHTEDWLLELDVNANGTGRYRLGVWARPAGK